MKKEKKNGFCLVIGYSRGGWGERRDFIRHDVGSPNDEPHYSSEICDLCFNAIEKKVIELRELMESRIDINEGVVVHLNPALPK